MTTISHHSPPSPQYSSLDFDQVCDGIEDCPLHEVGLGGEDEEGCQEAESSGEGEDRESDDSGSEEELSDNMEESNTESSGGRESDPIREPVVGGGSGLWWATTTTVDAPSSYDVTQVSPTSATSGDENENKPNQNIDQSDPSDNNDAPTTRPTLNRVSTSVKPADETQATTSSSSKPTTQSDSGVNVNLNVNVNVESGSGDIRAPSGGISGQPGGVQVQGEARPRSDDGLYGDCTSLNMPARFSSFR